jgi:hypothetical protein
MIYSIAAPTRRVKMIKNHFEFIELVILWMINMVMSIINIPWISYKTVLAEISDSPAPWTHEISVWLNAIAGIVVTIYGILKVLKENKSRKSASKSLSKNQIEDLIKKLNEKKDETPP